MYVDQAMDELENSVHIQRKSLVIAQTPHHEQPLNHQGWDMKLIHQSDL